MHRHAWASVLTIVIGIGAAQAGTMLPRTHETGVQLVEDGRPACTVVYPGGPETVWRELAERVADAIARVSDVHVPLVPDIEAVPQRLGAVRPELAGQNLVLLGDVNTNWAILPLYANYYTCCDAKYPGGDGYALRTIVRPFGNRASYLLVEASTPAGAAAGVARLIQLLGGLKPSPSVGLGFGLEMDLGSEMARILARFNSPRHAPTGISAEQGSDQAAETDSYGQMRGEFINNAHWYFYTGLEVFAETARDRALRLMEHDEHGIRIGDYHLEALATAWRWVSVSPAFSDEQRQLLDVRMYETAVEMERAWWRVKDASKGIGGRHQTTGMLAWWTLIRGLLELGEPDDEARVQLTQWRAECEVYLDGLLRHYSDDQDDYQSADSVQNAASYALQTGEWHWFDSGLARQAARRLLGVTDNLGWYAGIQGYGETLPGWERFTLNGGLLLGACRFVYDDGGYARIRERFPSLDKSWGGLQPWGLHQYATLSAPSGKTPTWLSGLDVVRFSPYRLERIRAGDFLTTELTDGSHVAGLKAVDIPSEHAFDKLVIRGRPDPQSMYLLLQGSSGSPLSTIDMNAIVRFTDQGRLWLVHNTARRSLFFKNAVYVSNGLNDEPLPACCELLASSDFDQAALAVSRLPDYCGTTWTRNLIVLHDRFVAVIDRVHADRPGRYTVCCTWRTPGFAALDGARWQSEQDGVTFTLSAGDAAGLSSERLPQPDGATRPTVLREQHLFDAKAGDDLFFENTLYTTGLQRPQEYEIRRIAPGALLIRAQGLANTRLYLAGVKGAAIPKIETDAQAFLACTEGIWLTGGSHLSLNGKRHSADKGYVRAAPGLREELQESLEHLWTASGGRPPTTQPRAEDGPAPMPEPSWTHHGPATRGSLVDGIRVIGLKHFRGSSLLATDGILPVLRAEPRLSPQGGGGFDPQSSRFLSKRQPEPAEPAEPVLAPAAGAEFEIRLPQPVRISEIAVFGDTFGETSAPVPPATIDLDVTFRMADTAGTDRKRRVSVLRQVTWHNLYKGHAYAFECYRITGLDEYASSVRVGVRGAPSPSMMISDIQVRAVDVAGAQPLGLRAVDLDGDGSDEILSWTAEGELVVLDGNGTERWRKTCAAGIIAVDAWDLDQDDKREILVSRSDRHVEALNLDGGQRWDSDFSDMCRRSDERLFNDGSAVFGMASWRRASAEQSELVFTSYWAGMKLDPQGRVKEWFPRKGHFTQVRSVPDRLAPAGALVMRSDIPWVGAGVMEWWQFETGKVALTHPVLNGPAVFFELDDYDCDGRAEAVVATEQGVGMYADRPAYTRWEHLTEAAPVGVSVVREPDQTQATIVYGRQDGYIFFVRADGQLLRSHLLGELMTCLTCLSAPERRLLVVGTPAGLRCLRWEDLREIGRREGSYQHVDVVRAGGRSRLLAITASGELLAFEL